jgi:hypothetical protein
MTKTKPYTIIDQVRESADNADVARRRLTIWCGNPTYWEDARGQSFEVWTDRDNGRKFMVDVQFAGTGPKFEGFKVYINEVTFP